MSIYGSTTNPSLMPGEWNPAGQTPDWGSIIAQGVGNTVQAAIGAAVQDKVMSGQLQYYGTAQNRTTSLLIVGALIYFLVAK